MFERLNKQLFNQARQYIPGGVNSPVRSFRAVGGYPVFIKSAKGAKIYSECGREFIDYCQGYGALILGHAHPKIVQELSQAVTKGSCFGAPTKLETELAELITAAVPSVQKIRLTNSGTEAVMGAIRLARAFTRKNKIIKFSGAYHGHADYLLSCPGVPEEFKKHTLTAPYNDIARVKQLVRQYEKDIAAIIVEPVAANMGVVLAQEGFLPGLREIADKHNIVLIFDEVITGFRFAFGGAQKSFKLKPDLTCLGKIIGGGLPIGAFGGKKEIMQLLAPEGNVYQAGTFSGNLLSVTAGLTTLRTLSERSPYLKLEESTKQLCRNINSLAQRHRIKIKINFIGSLFSIFFTNKPVSDYNSVRAQNTGLFKRFYHGLLKAGVYFSPSGFEANFLSAAHNHEDLEKTLKAVDKTFKEVKKWR